MTHEAEPATARHGDDPEEQPATPDAADVEREAPPEEMSQGLNHPSAAPENQGDFDPASTRAPQGGGPD